MNKHGLLVTLLSTGVVAAVACSSPQTSDDDDGSSAGGSTGTTSSTASTGTTTPASTSTGGITGSGGSGAADPGGTTSICGSELGYQSSALNDCVTANCCSTFDPCAADTACLECLTSETATGCDTNELYQAYDTCKETNCSTGMCDTPIGFTSNGDPLFECNTCGSANCCTDLTACVGDSSDTAVNLCIECLNDPAAAACSDATIKAAAEAFNSCIATNCASECPSG